MLSPCVGFFSIVVRRHRDQGNIFKKGWLGLWCQRISVFDGGVKHGGRCGNSKFARILIDKQEAERTLVMV